MTKEMNSEHTRIRNLLSIGRITKEEHQNLMAALDKKQSALQKLFFIFINPFEKVPGISSIAMGLVFIAILSLIGA